LEWWSPTAVWFGSVPQAQQKQRSLVLCATLKARFSCSAEDFAQFTLGAFKYPLPRLRQIFAGAIDVKVQQRHCGLIRRALAPFAAFSGAFQGASYFARVT
jgi:hypothetical protein